MYVVIIGAGRIGASTARWLVAADHEVAAVDQDEHRCAALDSELGGISVVGDGTEAGVLARAGVNRADIFIATTNSDEDNMVACQLARHRFGVSYTVSLVSVPEYERLFNLLGIGVIINTTDLISSRLRDVVSGRLVEEVGSLG